MATVEAHEMEWDHELPGCFAAMTAPFGLHPNDEERAFNWLTSLRERKIGWSAAKTQVEAYLKSRGVRGGEFTKQVERAGAMLQPWLRD
jgi:hypothetical protein